MIQEHEPEKKPESWSLEYISWFLFEIFSAATLVLGWCIWDNFIKKVHETSTRLTTFGDAETSQSLLALNTTSYFFSKNLSPSWIYSTSWKLYVCSVLLLWYLGGWFSNEKLKMYFFPCPFQPILLLPFEPTETSQPKKKLQISSKKLTTTGWPGQSGFAPRCSSSWKVKWRRSSQVPLAPIEAFKAKPVGLGTQRKATLLGQGFGWFGVIFPMKLTAGTCEKCWDFFWIAFPLLGGDGCFRKSRVDLCNSCLKHLCIFHLDIFLRIDYWSWACFIMWSIAKAMKPPPEVARPG